MPATEKMQSWQSIHSDYIAFAVSSHRAAQEEASPQLPSTHINRHVVDSVRYSFDCLESSVEFVHTMGRLHQLPIPLPDNWLTRYMSRTWGSLSLSDRLGILAYGWAGATFWASDRQYRLFAEWKKVRDGLTHPIPFGTEIEREIIREDELEAGAHLKMWRFIGQEKQIGPEAMSFSSGKSLAQFSQNPTSLSPDDASKALELLLRHLIRLEDMFFRARTTWFAYFDTHANKLQSTHDLLNGMKVSFQDIW